MTTTIKFYDPVTTDNITPRPGDLHIKKGEYFIDVDEVGWQITDVINKSSENSFELSVECSPVATYPKDRMTTTIKFYDRQKRLISPLPMAISMEPGGEFEDINNVRWLIERVDGEYDSCNPPNYNAKVTCVPAILRAPDKPPDPEMFKGGSVTFIPGPDISEKFIQISCSENELYALDENGRVWRHSTKGGGFWARLTNYRKDPTKSKTRKQEK